ncbi:hypothetical protein GCM10027443_14660 [Pontibacter brevis]
MTKFALLLPLALASQVAFAQSASTPVGLDAERNLAELGNGMNATMVRTYDNRYEGVKGTPFFREDWNKATITNKNTVYRNVDVKYNVYENVLLYRSDDEKEFVLNPSKVDSFVLTDSKTKKGYTFKQVPALATQDVKLLSQFVVVLHEGEKVQLVMVPEKAFVKADFKGAYSSGKTYDELVDSQSFYLIGSDKTVNKVKLNKKSLLKALPDKKDKVQDYAASNNLNLNSGEGWAKALAYYETL